MRLANSYKFQKFLTLLQSADLDTFRKVLFHSTVYALQAARQHGELCSAAARVTFAYRHNVKSNSACLIPVLVVLVKISSNMSKRLHVKCPLLLPDFNKTRSFSTDFSKNSNIKFNQNPSSGSRVVPCGQTDMMKLTVFFCAILWRRPKKDKYY